MLKPKIVPTHPIFNADLTIPPGPFSDFHGQAF